MAMRYVGLGAGDQRTDGEEREGPECIEPHRRQSCLDRNRCWLVALGHAAALYALVLLVACAQIWVAARPESLLSNPLAHASLATPAVWTLAVSVCAALPPQLHFWLQGVRSAGGSAQCIGEPRSAGSWPRPLLDALCLLLPPAALALLFTTSAGACVAGRPVDPGNGACICDRVVARGLPVQQGGRVPAELTLAFVGDSGIAHGDEVLRLIRDERSSAVIFNGDTAYMQQNEAWLGHFRRHLGATPFYVAAGSGATESFRAFQERTARHWASSNVTGCQGEIGVWNTCTHRGIGLLLSGTGDSCGLPLRARTDLFEEALTEFVRKDVQWPICVFDFHSNQPRSGSGASTWDNYELCLKRGALIITSHAQQYARSHEVDLLSAASPHAHVSRRVEPGSSPREAAIMRDGHSMVVFTGFGSAEGMGKDGAAWHGQEPVQTLRHGAFFCRFHVDGNPSLAHCYFKDVAGHLADDFYLRREQEGKPAVAFV